MNYSRFITTVSAARKASPIRLLSEYMSLLPSFSESTILCSGLSWGIMAYDFKRFERKPCCKLTKQLDFCQAEMLSRYKEKKSE